MQIEVCIQEPFWQYQDGRGADEKSESKLSHDIPGETWEQWVQKWLEVMQVNLSPLAAYELTLRLTNDTEIRSLNAQYRQIDEPTDVLAFAALEDAAPEIVALQAEIPLYLGDIIISVETAQRQAKAAQRSLTDELVWLAAHGFLHLLGWDHPDQTQLAAMLTQQNDLLKAVGVTP
ncbi:MAG: rRNA maturation RNase YbeY [Leptolyngbyaceae cyanobacterium]